MSARAGNPRNTCISIDIRDFPHRLPPTVQLVDNINVTTALNSTSCDVWLILAQYPVKAKNPSYWRISYIRASDWSCLVPTGAMSLRCTRCLERSISEWRSASCAGPCMIRYRPIPPSPFAVTFRLVGVHGRCASKFSH